MRFVWDERKRRSNLNKHGLEFSDAPLVFQGDFFYLADDRQDYGETRYIGIGELSDRVIVIVFCVVAEETYRIISMREATPRERELFYGS
ncbi:MAG: BrnT family toxin [Desulfovibrionaceae bacterium]|nr:BrnT family toxin [Desulfovibrionaceae bacterium]MBF0514394.1 BrnT family toxin [Desulfovibrionaceae bacterium]